MNNAQKKIALQKQVQALTASAEKTQREAKEALAAKVTATLASAPKAPVKEDPLWKRTRRKASLASKVSQLTGETVTASAGPISILSFELISAQMERNRRK